MNQEAGLIVEPEEAAALATAKHEPAKSEQLLNRAHQEGSSEITADLDNSVVTISPSALGISNKPSNISDLQAEPAVIPTQSSDPSTREPIMAADNNTDEVDNSPNFFDDDDNASSAFFDNIGGQASNQGTSGTNDPKEMTTKEPAEDPFKALFDDKLEDEADFLGNSVDPVANDFYEKLETKNTKPAKTIDEAALGKIFENDSEEEITNTSVNQKKDLSKSLAFLDDDNDFLPDDYVEPTNRSRTPKPSVSSPYKSPTAQPPVSHIYSPQTSPRVPSSNIIPPPANHNYSPQLQASVPSSQYVPQTQTGPPTSPYAPKIQPHLPNSTYVPKVQPGPPTSPYAPKAQVAPPRKTHVSRHSMPNNAFDLPTELVSETARIYQSHHPIHSRPQPSNAYGSFNQASHNPVYPGVAPAPAAKPYFSDLPKISTQLGSSTDHSVQRSGSAPTYAHRAHFRNYSGSLPVNNLNSNMYQPYSKSPAIGSPLSSNAPIDSSYIQNNNNPTQQFNKYEPAAAASPTLSRYDPRGNVTKPPITQVSQHSASNSNVSSPVISQPRNSAFGDMPADIGLKQAELYRSPEVQQAIQNARHYRSMSGSNWNSSLSPVTSSPTVGFSQLNENKRYSMPASFGGPPGPNSLSSRPASAAPAIIDNETLMRRQFPIFRWGMGGKATCLIPPQIAFGGAARAPEVKVIHTSSVINADSDIKKFPFPLVTGKGVQKNKKKELEKWIENHIDNLEKSLGFQRNDDSSRFANRVLLWKISLSLLQGESNTQKPGMPLKEAIRMILDPHVVVEAHKDEATFAPAVDVYKKLQRHGSNGGMPMGRILKSEDINKIADLLKVGLKENALKYSLDNHLWSHAFIIASSMSPAEWVSSVAEFVREEIREFPSQSSRDLALIYRIFSGAGADAVSEILPGQFATAINEPQVGPQLKASLASWKSTISMMFSNSSPANSEAAKMYSSLLLRAGNVEASHLCDVLFNIGVFGSSTEDTPSFELFGSDPESGAGLGRDIDSILLSLVLEFYKISTEPVLPTIPYYPHLVLYKLQLTSYLADLGSVNEAQNLFDSVSSIVKTAGKTIRYSQPLYKFMDFVSQRLSLTYQDETSSSWLSSKLGRPKLDKMLGQLDKSFSKFVTGEDDTENANVGDNGIFKKLAETPTASRIQSAVDISAMNPLSSQPNMLDNYGVPRAEGYSRSSVNLQSYATHSRNSSLVNLSNIEPVLSPPPSGRYQVDQRAPSPANSHRALMGRASASSGSLVNDYSANSYNLSRPESASTNRSRRSSFRDGYEKQPLQQQQQHPYNMGLNATPGTLAPGFAQLAPNLPEERTHRRSSSNVSISSNITGSPRKSQYQPANPYVFPDNQPVVSSSSVNNNKYAPQSTGYAQPAPSLSFNGSMPPSPQHGRKTPNSMISKPNVYSPQNSQLLSPGKLPYSEKSHGSHNASIANSPIPSYQNVSRPASIHQQDLSRPGSTQPQELSRPGSTQPLEVSRPGSAQPLKPPRPAYGQQQSSSRRGSIHSPGSSRPASTHPDESLALSPKRNSGGATNPNPESTSIHHTPTTPRSVNSVRKQVAPPVNPYASLSNNPYDPAAQLHEKSPYAPSSASSLSHADKYSPSASGGSAAKYAPATEKSFSASNVVENYDDVSFGSIYGYTPANQDSAEPAIPEEPETVGDSKVDDINKEGDNEEQQSEEEEPYEEYEAPQYGNSTDEDNDDEGVLDDLPEASDRIFTPMSAPTFTPSPAINSEKDSLNGSAIFHESKESNEDDEDFGLSNSAIKPRKPVEKSDKEETANKRSSWFSFFRKSSSGEKATQINLGEEMSLVYDPVLKRYVNKNAPKESLKPEPKHAPPPPGPSMTPNQPSTPTSVSATTTPPSNGPPRSLSAQPHASSPMTGGSPVKPSLTPGPSLTGDLDDLLSSAPTPTGHSRKHGKRNARSKYVDIMHQ